MEESDRKKVFVGGISLATTNDTLEEHFNKYGSVVGCAIAKNRNTGTPRGFAFVSFSDSSAVDEALLHTHNILGRTVEVKKVTRRSDQNQQESRDLSRNDQFQSSRDLSRSNSRSNGRRNDQFMSKNNSRSNGRSNDQFRTKKIFVGGLSAKLTDEEFNSYFEKFGRITDVVVMHDNVTHRPRGFGFITFDSEDAVEDVMQTSFHELRGKLVEVKRAVPKEGNNTSIDDYDYNVQVGSGSGPNFNSYQHENYTPYSPGYGFPPGYGAISGYGGFAGYPYGAGVFWGGYPNGVYGGIGYGVTLVAPTIMSARGSPMPYGYPPYVNNGVGVMGVAANGYNGLVGAGKSSQVGLNNGVGVMGVAANGYNGLVGAGKSSQVGGADSQVATSDATSSEIVMGNVDVNSSGDSS